MRRLPLRAYLMARTESGSWSVSVSTELQDILQSWELILKDEPATGVLHIGFERPPSHTFENIAAQYSGYMLLTSAAKEVISPSFEASKKPIGVAESHPLYMGLNGWGYLVDDPTIKQKNRDGDSSESKELVPSGWIAGLLQEIPAVGSTLAQYEIVDEDSYLENESKLDRETRIILGDFRARHFSGDNSEDPCELARAMPLWVKEKKLQELRLPIRAKNVFNKNHIQSIGDICSWSSGRLLKLPNFGRKSLKDTLEALNQALIDGPNEDPEEISLSPSGSLLSEILLTLDSLADRESDVFLRRLGYYKNAETLERIAKDYNVSRERVRQIEARVLKKIIRHSRWVKTFRWKLNNILEQCDYPIPVAGIEALDQWFRDTSSRLLFLRSLVKTMCEGTLHVIEIDGLQYLTKLSQDDWNDITSQATEILSSGCGQGWSEAYAKKIVQGLLPENAKALKGTLWDRVSTHCHFSEIVNGPRILTSYGRGVEQVVTALLEEAEKPLHFSEIAARAESRLGRKVDIRRAHNAAANVGLLFGRGEYGVERHIPLSEVQIGIICNEVENIVCGDEEGRQWHTSEILSELMENQETMFDKLDKYLLDILLKRSSMLKSLRRMTWTEAQNSTDDVERIDIRQAIISLIKDAERPLTTSEIKEKLVSVRGVNEFFQIFPNGSLIRLKPGLWGIRERDLKISPADIKELINDLITALANKQKAIHISELCTEIALADCPPEAFLSIASTDKRIKVGAGRYVYLTEWRDPRRETVFQAVSNVLASSLVPLKFEKILSLVSSRIDRDVSTSLVSNALQALGATFNQTTLEWSRGRRQR